MDVAQNGDTVSVGVVMPGVVVGSGLEILGGRAAKSWLMKLREINVGEDYV